MRPSQKGLRVSIIVFITAFITSLLCVPLHLHAQRDVRFERLTSRQGLSQATVQCMMQDSKGFMWFGTQDGLNRWDGRTMKTFRYNPRSRSLSSNDVHTIYEDHNGTLWVGTQSGLNAFNRATEEFITFKSDSKDPSSLSNNNVTAIIEDKQHTLWVGTYAGGLCKFVPSATNALAGTFVAYKWNPNNPTTLSSNIIMRLAVDKVTGELWVGCYGGGLHRYAPERNSFTSYFADSIAQQYVMNKTPFRGYSIEALSQARSSQFWIGRDGEGAGVERFDFLPMSKSGSFKSLASMLGTEPLPTKIIRSVYEDRAGNLWVGTKGAGLVKVELATGKTTIFKNDPTNLLSLGDNTILSIYEDRTGTLWFGTDNGGVSYFNPNARKFIGYSEDPSNSRSLSARQVWSLYEDRAGTVWVGTDYGLNRMDSKPLSGEARFTSYLSNPEDPSTLSADEVTAICEARTGTLWIGTSGGGLNRFERSAVSGLGAFRAFKPDEENPRSLSNEFVQALLEDRMGTLWVATNKGLNRLDGFNDKGEAEFTRFLNSSNPKSLSNNVTTCLYEDRQGTLWVGTIDGLNRFERIGNTFTVFKGENISTPANPAKSGGKPDAKPANAEMNENLSDNYIMSMYEDKAGNFWIGTQGGLNRFDRATGKFKVITVRDGLPNDFIYGILEDNKGNLWLSTNKGLCRYNPTTGAVRVYDERDGLQSDEFSNGAYFKGRSGLLYFGSSEGFNVFHPDSIRENSTAPQLAFTDFATYDPRKGVTLHYNLDSIMATADRTVELPYRENSFTITFAAMSFVFTDKNKYRYKLEGYDQYWIEAGSQQAAVYKNLEPGEYEFYVQGSNYDGIMNAEGAKVTIVIVPPIYKRWWFSVLAALGIVALIVGIYRWRVKAIESQKQELERLVTERTKELEETNAELSQASEEIQRQNNELLRANDELETAHKEIQEQNALLARQKDILEEQSRDIELANGQLQETNAEIIRANFELDARNDALNSALSSLQQAQTQLVQSEKMASLGQLLAGVAHEINNPVNFISGAVKPLRRNVDKLIEAYRSYTAISPNALTPETLESVRSELVRLHEQGEDEEMESRIGQINDLVTSVSEGAERISDIVGLLRNFSRADTTEMKAVNIHEGLDSTLKLLYNQYKKHVTIVKEYGDVPQVECYAGQLNQVFMNILANAVQAVPPDRQGGEIRIKTERDGADVVIRIRDNGVGMSDEVRKRIFDPFYTTKEVGKGTGLGLSISFSIIEKHQGSISVESERGKGSEFTIRLPFKHSR
jgi:signal transduction histidine kinase/ligand-binding sensor domain-containing protein